MDEIVNDKGTNLHGVPIVEPIVSLPPDELNDDNNNSNKGKEIQLVEPTHQETKPNIVERQNEVLNLQDISMIQVEVERPMTRWKKRARIVSGDISATNLITSRTRKTNLSVRQDSDNDVMEESCSKKHKSTNDDSHSIQTWQRLPSSPAKIMECPQMVFLI